ncbi:hypothetical protein GOP47_0016817 [Adiantum capillus-veneris]|uniref:RING-type domain-containing protein n=1 Tax=Adiantum capillus-veneris TaxID=13818 RepID=A0A9D4UJ29_ADICA|nr:hypothetical protein GOP47_0016817 [Adiantum capillus-veneris]
MLHGRYPFGSPCNCRDTCWHHRDIRSFIFTVPSVWKLLYLQEQNHQSEEGSIIFVLRPSPLHHQSLHAFFHHTHHHSFGMEPSSRKASASFSDSSSSDENGEFSYKNFRFRPKKKRRQDAGRRHQRGLVYDSTLGITCHFCRQKTTRPHVYCRKCVLALCGSCLRNRHGEELEVEVADDNWLCPMCRGGCGRGCKNCCNCTFCRKKQGLKPPKFAAGELRAHGFDNVHDYLIHLETGESAYMISARKSGKGWCSSYEKKKSDLPQESPQKEWRRSKERLEESTMTAASIYSDAEYEEKPLRGLDQSVATQDTEKAKQIKDIHQVKNADRNKNFNNAVRTESPSKDAHLKDNFERDPKRTMDAKVVSAESLPQAKAGSFIPNQFRSRSEFMEKLQEKLAEPFDDQEVKKLWAAITCRKPACKISETNPGISAFPAKELGHSYIHHHPDFVKKYTATGEPEVKLKLLRGFFFWLEHGSMQGSFKPWIDNATDEECLELNGPDCQFLGELLNLEKEHLKPNAPWQGGCEEDIKPDIKKSCLLSQSKLRSEIVFNWDEEDIKPKVKS